MPKNLIQIDKITADFSQLIEVAPNHDLYLALAKGSQINHEVRDLALPPGYRLVRVDMRLEISREHFEIALLNDVTAEVVYYNRVVTHIDKALNCRPVSQVLVWRSNDPMHTAAQAGLPGKIFLGYLIERYDVVVSDINQTNAGMNFWITRMYEAIYFGLNVYAYDVLTGELFAIKDKTGIGNYQKWLWGDADNFQHRLAIISKMSLPC